MSAKKPNIACGVDVSHTGPEYPAVSAYTRVSDIDDGHVWMLMEHALRQGGEVGDRIKTLWGFEPSAAELEALAIAVARLAPEKEPWARLYGPLPLWYREALGHE